MSSFYTSSWSKGDDSKHEAFDPARRFVWFDDDPDPEALEWLERQNLAHALVRTRTASRDNPLHMLETLKRLVG
jgi:hypothetical protein